ncbi:sperm flagellar protein 1 [Microcaecilia unicolor]|uniref:Sperm flagellar protein 1-like n=1 Tax=Microcaecilia unicolor TaxID=1415580 RepID=A0A6P7Y6W6_9AMPH|nr:sperm flagellar protein 1-like [Microcaecilia unicolor]
MNSELKEESLQELYAWIDQIPLSRPKRNIARDFSDGVMVAEVVKYFLPKLVDMHNYVPANSTLQKLSNWGILNKKVFSKLNFHVPEDSVKNLVANVSGVIEPILYALRQTINEKLQEKRVREKATTQTKDFRYYSTDTEKSPLDYITISSYGKNNPNQTPPEWTYSHAGRSAQSLGERVQLDPQVRLLLEEKEQDLLALNETVQILQLKINRLEHLVQLKDLRIEELTRHLKNYKFQKSAT